MAGADGSIRIRPILDNKEIETDLSAMEKMMRQTANHIKKVFNGSMTTDSLKKQIKEQNQVIKENEKQLQSYQKALDNIDGDKAVKEIERLMVQNDKSIEKAKQKIEEYQKKLDAIDIKKGLMTSEEVMNSRIGFNDTDINVDKRVEQSLAGNKNFQKLLSDEQAIVDKMDEYSSSIRKAESKAEALRQTLANTKAELSTGYASGIEKSNMAIEEANKKVDFLSSKLAKLKGKADISKDVNKSGSSLNSASRSAKKFGDHVKSSAEKGMKKLIKLGAAIFSIRGAYTLARRAASEYLSSNEQLANQIQGIWNAVAQAVGPIINQIISWVVTLISYINAFIKMLTGIDLVAKGNAAALNKQASAAGNVAKETEKANRQLASFDEMNVLQDNSSSDGGGGGGGASVPQLSVDTIDFDDLEDKFMKLLKPIQNAWDKYGADFIDSFKYGLNSIWQLVKAIGSSFEEVWTNGTGEATCSFILQILTNIFNTVGNVASGLREAWLENETGTKIVQALWNAFNNLLALIEIVTGALEKVAGNIDFSPLLNGVLLISQVLETMMDSLKNIADSLVSGDFKEAGKIAANYFNDGFSGIYDFIDSIDWVGVGHSIGTFIYDGIIGTLSMILTFFTTLDWSLIGETITSGIQALVEMGVAFLLSIDWANVGIMISDALYAGFCGIVELVMSIDWGGLIHDIIELMLAALILGLTAIASYALENVQNQIDFVMSVIDKLASFLGDIYDYICGIIGDLCAWFDEKFHEAWDNIVNIFSGVKQWALDRLADITDVFSSIGEWFGERFGEAWECIMEFFSASEVKEYFDSVWKNIKNAFGSVAGWFKDKFSKAWQAVKDIFSTGGKIFDGIKEGILNGLKEVINAIIGGINKVIKVPFDGLNWALDNLRSVSILGMKPFGWIGTISVPQIPKLERGGIVNNPGRGVNMGDYIAGERGAEAIVPLENSDFIKSFAREIAGLLSEMNAPMQIVLKVGDKEFYRWFINMKRKYEFVTNG